MLSLSDVFSTKVVTVLLIGSVMVFSSGAVLAKSANHVSTYKDTNGWKLKVDGKDFYIKGVVWGYSPQDENYTYNLWGQKDEVIKEILDHDFSLMKDAGVNAIRTFSNIPPKWVTYAYEKYGIMTAVNPLMGRYGVNVGGKWMENTDYSDPATREVLKKEVRETVEKFKDVPGVLMFALGNESNYGLSWKSFEIENLPQGEQNQTKARYLYSLFDEAIDDGKKIAPHYPFTIVNGDIQYIDLIAEYGKDWDLLGVNAYRGDSFTGLWKDVKNKLGLPVAFFEFGSDAFNAKDRKEDQLSQASYLKNQWQEMYRKSYGKGEEGNSIGGFVFEWRDEWWKYKQTENLDRHDRTASWANGGYKFDHVEGQNNMNEEWWGINRLGEPDANGVYAAEPRIAYDVLSEVWSIDPYTDSKSAINQKISKIEPKATRPSHEVKDAEAFRFVGGSIRGDTLIKGLGNDTDYSEKGLMGFFDFEFEATPNLRGDFTVNAIGDSSDSDFEFKYGDRIHDKTGSDARKIELYDFQASYEGEKFDLLGFYHVPRYHWGYKGDFFGLLHETTDMEGQDIWNSKAPAGVEFVGKGALDGLNIVAGPEVYWGANPKAILKYQFGKDKQYTFMHAEDYDQRTDSSGGGAAIGQHSAQTTLQGKFEPKPGVALEVGAIVSNSHKVGDKYDRMEGGNVIENTIKTEDTIGVKAKVSTSVTENIKAYATVNYAGLVADAGDPLKELGTQLPYSSLGNKKELELGLDISKGDYTISPRLLYRDNIVDANPLINPSISGTTLTPGIEPRNTDSDPFAVLGNRAARSAEVNLTYDPTPATQFYAWDNDLREDAKFAYNVGLNVTHYPTATDANLFFYEEGNRNAAFGEGLSKETVGTLKSKMVFNPKPGVKAVVKGEIGKQQPTGKPAAATQYASLEGKLVLDNKHVFTAGYKKDAWGPYDFERQFDLKYPEQVELGYVNLLDKGKSEKKSSKIGVKASYRTLDKNSNNEFYQDGKNKDMFEVKTFFEYNF